MTFDNSIVIVDECQNMNFHELEKKITRIGADTKINFGGDFFQSDLVDTNERNGYIFHENIRKYEIMNYYRYLRLVIL